MVSLLVHSNSLEINPYFYFFPAGNLFPVTAEKKTKNKKEILKKKSIPKTEAKVIF